MTRTFAAALVTCITLWGCKSAPSAGPTSPTPATIVSAVETGAPQPMADLMVTLAHSDSNAWAVAPLMPLLASSDSAVRRRAAMLLGAAGISARSAAPALASLLRDSDVSVRREAAYALGAVGATDSLSTDALVAALLNPSDGRLSWQARHAFERVAHVGWMTPGAATTRFVRTSISDTSPARCGPVACSHKMQVDALAVLDKLDAPWKRAVAKQALSAPQAEVRHFAAWTLANMGPLAIEDTAAIAALRADPEQSLRDQVDAVLDRLEHGPHRSAYLPSNPETRCYHRQIDDDPGGGKALIPATLTIGEGPSLRGDGRGAYDPGDGIESSHSYSYNFVLPFAVSGERAVYRQQAPDHAGAARFVVVDLSHPVNRSSPAFRAVRDSAFEIHFFFMRDRSGYIWNTRDIPIGATVKSDLTDVYTSIGGKPYNIRFGPFALSTCSASFGLTTGEGTTQATVQRLSESEWRLTLPKGSRGRVWDFTHPQAPKDLGSYDISFQLLISSR